MMMLVPEAWQDNQMMDKDRKAFYKFHAALMEPWDGPAALIVYRWEIFRSYFG
jgi:glutamate synthase (NADPH) large chain